MARNKLYINETNIANYGIYISSDTYLDSPKIDYAEFQIPAKNGTAILDNKRLNNVIRKFDCYIPESGNVENSLGQLKRLLYTNKGYLKLSSDYDPSYYQYGYLAQEINVKPFNKKAAEFSLYFSCLPQKYEDVNALHTTTYNDTNTYLSQRLSNDSRIITPLLVNAKVDYPYSPVGWVHKNTVSFYLSQGSYSIVCTSSTTQKYMVTLKKEVLGSPTVYSYEIIGEVDNYNGTFSFDVPAHDQYTNYFIDIFAPLFDYDHLVSFTVGADSGTLKFEYNPITSPDFVNLGAMGCRPVFIYKKKIGNIQPSTYNDGGYDLLTLNGNMYLVNYSRMAQDYTIQSIFNVCAHYDSAENEYYLYVKIDPVNAKMYFLDTFAMDGTVLMDVSSYLLKYETGSFEGTNTIIGKFASNNFNTIGVLKNISFTAGWWKL